MRNVIKIRDKWIDLNAIVTISDIRELKFLMIQFEFVDGEKQIILPDFKDIFKEEYKDARNWRIHCGDENKEESLQRKYFYMHLDEINNLYRNWVLENIIEPWKKGKEV